MGSPADHRSVLTSRSVADANQLGGPKPRYLDLDLYPRPGTDIPRTIVRKTRNEHEEHRLRTRVIKLEEF